MKKKPARKTASRPSVRPPASKNSRSAALQDRFLAAVSRSANITEAARAAGVARGDHYRWLRDPEYRRRFLDAREAALDDLELEAWNRAKAGSDRLLMFLLTAYRTRFRADAPPPVGPADPELAEMDEGELLHQARSELQRLGLASLDEVWADGK